MLDALTGIAAFGALIAGALHVLGPGHGKSGVIALALTSPNRRAVLTYCLKVAVGHSFGAVIVGFAIFLGWSEFRQINLFHRLGGSVVGVAVCVVGLILVRDAFRSTDAPLRSNEHASKTRHVHRNSPVQRSTSENMVEVTNLASWSLAWVVPAVAFLPSPVGISLVIVPLYTGDRFSALLLPMAYGVGALITLLSLGLMAGPLVSRLESKLSRGRRVRRILTIGSGVAVAVSGVVIAAMSWSIEIDLSIAG